MQLRSRVRALLLTSSAVALAAALVHCKSSHPPAAEQVGNDNTSSGDQKTCYDPVEGGCSLPLIVSSFPTDTPITESDLIGQQQGKGVSIQICTDVATGGSICGDFHRLVTCVSPGVFVVRSSPPCDFDAAAGDAATGDADAADDDSGDAGAD